MTATSKKSPKNNTIMVSAKCYGKLCKIKTELEEIFDTSLSFSSLIEALIVAKVDWSDLLLIKNESVVDA